MLEHSRRDFIAKEKKTENGYCTSLPPDSQNHGHPQRALSVSFFWTPPITSCYPQENLETVSLCGSSDFLLDSERKINFCLKPTLRFTLPVNSIIICNNILYSQQRKPSGLWWRAAWIFIAFNPESKISSTCTEPKGSLNWLSWNTLHPNMNLKTAGRFKMAQGLVSYHHGHTTAGLDWVKAPCSMSIY